MYPKTRELLKRILEIDPNQPEAIQIIREEVREHLDDWGQYYEVASVHRDDLKAVGYATTVSDDEMERLARKMGDNIESGEVLRIVADCLEFAKEEKEFTELKWEGKIYLCRFVDGNLFAPTELEAELFMDEDHTEPVSEKASALDETIYFYAEADEIRDCTNYELEQLATV